MVNFIILIILHILGDFYLQSNKLVKCKNAIIDENCGKCNKCKESSNVNYQFLFLHVILYTIPFLFVFYITDLKYAIFIIIIVSITHFCVDLINCYINKKIKKTFIFFIDQSIHIIILFILFKVFTFNSKCFEYFSIIKIILVTLLVILPSSIFINKLFEDCFSNIKGDKLDPQKEISSSDNQASEKKNIFFDVGSIIGVLERILVIIFSCFGNFAAIAIIITVKTWARSNDLKETTFRNKYLLGTLSSIVLALMIYLVYINI